MLSWRTQRQARLRREERKQRHKQTRRIVQVLFQKYSWTVDELVTESGLPGELVSNIVARLERGGWIERVHALPPAILNRVVYRITDSGVHRLQNEFHVQDQRQFAEIGTPMRPDREVRTEYVNFEY